MKHSVGVLTAPLYDSELRRQLEYSGRLVRKGVKHYGEVQKSGRIGHFDDYYVAHPHISADPLVPRLAIELYNCLENNSFSRDERQFFYGQALLTCVDFLGKAAETERGKPQPNKSNITRLEGLKEWMDEERKKDLITLLGARLNEE